MIKYRITIIDTIRIDELLIIDLITGHFGKNPKNGGNPPRNNNEEDKNYDFVIII